MMTNKVAAKMNLRRYAMFLAIIYFTLFLVLSYPVDVTAQEENPVTDDEVNAVAKELYCPVCENVPLDVCPTTACAQWRELIREKIREGWTPEEIKVYLAEQYGDRVLAEPPRSGINWLVYILPPALILAGAVYLGLNIRRMKKDTAIISTTQPTDIQPQDEYMAKIEAELKKRES
jgi:cytochrome c-type biogenesis protein CcmH